MGYNLYFKIVNPRRKQRIWFRWLSRYIKPRKKICLQRFSPVNVIIKNKRTVKSWHIVDFGMLVESVEKYQSAQIKEIIIYEKDPFSGV